MFQIRYVEELVDLYEEPITRWLDGELKPEDQEIMMQIIDDMLPDDQIMWPPYVMFTICNGHITLTTHILEITTAA